MGLHHLSRIIASWLKLTAIPDYSPSKSYDSGEFSPERRRTNLHAWPRHAIRSSEIVFICLRVSAWDAQASTCNVDRQTLTHSKRQLWIPDLLANAIGLPADHIMRGIEVVKVIVMYVVGALSMIYEHVKA